MLTKMITATMILLAVQMAYLAGAYSHIVCKIKFTPVLCFSVFIRALLTCGPSVVQKNLDLPCAALITMDSIYRTWFLSSEFK